MAAMLTNVQGALTSWIVSSVVDFADVKPSDIEGAIVLGYATLQKVNLKRHRINSAFPDDLRQRIQCTGAVVEKLTVAVPWLSLSAKPIEVEADGIQVALGPNDIHDGACAEQETPRADRERDLRNEIVYWASTRPTTSRSATVSHSAASDFESCASGSAAGVTNGCVDREAPASSSSVLRTNGHHTEPSCTTSAADVDEDYQSCCSATEDLGSLDAHSHDLSGPHSGLVSPRSDDNGAHSGARGQQARTAAA